MKERGLPDHIAVFTDGACLGNPGPGGWAAVVLHPRGQVRELGGRSAQTTNNRMELAAAIAAFRALKEETFPMTVYADSKYVILGITSWIASWKRRGWRTASGEGVLNRDLWQELDARVAAYRGPIAWEYVRGHSGVPGNERCDALAVSFAQGAPLTLYKGHVSGYEISLLPLP
ncbi:MAG: ribonuclease HI [Elusimicrobia bacterium]|nr:ribonuclease HI [Elusimicrobiota bacterium]